MICEFGATPAPDDNTLQLVWMFSQTKDRQKYRNRKERKEENDPFSLRIRRNMKNH